MLPVLQQLGDAYDGL